MSSQVPASIAGAYPQPVDVPCCSTPDAVIEQTHKEAEAAPEVQDDFDIGVEDEALLDVKDRPEVQVRTGRLWHEPLKQLLNVKNAPAAKRRAAHLSIYHAGAVPMLSRCIRSTHRHYMRPLRTCCREGVPWSFTSWW